MGRKATLLGATGLIGTALVDMLLKDNYYDEVNLILRKSVPIDNPKLKQHIINFENRDEYVSAIAGSETVFCAVGTTMKKVKGNHDAYRKVDYDIPVTAATVAAQQSCFSFVLVSAVGANKGSAKNFYLRLKGEVEAAISQLPIPAIHFFRPSLLLGDRKEKRTMEKIGQVIWPALSALLPGSWSKYKAISAEEVANAMLRAGKDHQKGIMVYEYDDIKKIAKATEGPYRA